jgi:hypothetical protein
MRTTQYTAFVLSVIALALIVLAGEELRDRTTVVHAAGSRQGWEYKFVERGYKGQNGNITVTAYWKEDGNPPPPDQNNIGGLSARVRALGSEGWELVSDTAYSRHMKVDTTNGLAANGVTSDETLIFKRPAN